ncbi:MAG TPA: carboxypeptidase-like regulatory domain-containing protein, partial [Bacteroidales bacterium]|nr:carboxypeptidase-like regulatory domain-containing protein [Bacteroidales bacterium]
MKTLKKNLTWFGLFIFLLGGHNFSQAQNHVITITGVLKDAKTGDKISYATISVPNTNIGTVSNSEGEF